MDQRIDDLEKKFSFQELTIEQLNEVMVAQQKQIDELEQKVILMREYMMSSGLVKNKENEEPPPHY